MLLPHPLLHNNIRTAVVAACEQASLESLSTIAEESEGDTIDAVDRVYANSHIQQQIQPLLQKALRQRQLIPPE